jgi:hypothetical protein
MPFKYCKGTCKKIIWVCNYFLCVRVLFSYLVTEKPHAYWCRKNALFNRNKVFVATPYLHLDLKFCSVKLPFCADDFPPWWLSWSCLCDYVNMCVYLRELTISRCVWTYRTWLRFHVFPVFRLKWKFFFPVAISFSFLFVEYSFTLQHSWLLRFNRQQPFVVKATWKCINEFQRTNFQVASEVNLIFFSVPKESSKWFH